MIKKRLYFSLGDISWSITRLETPAKNSSHGQESTKYSIKEEEICGMDSIF